MKHQLIKTNGEWHCQVCLWNWKVKPATNCSGVPRYTWGTKPDYLLAQTTLKKLGFNPPERYSGVIYYKKNKFWELYDVRQSTHKKGETWENALKRLTIEQEKKTKKAELKTAFYWLECRLHYVQKDLEKIINLLDDDCNTSRFFHSRSERIERAEAYIKLFPEIVKIAKQDLVNIQKLLGKYPHPQAAALGGRQQQGPRPWDAVLGGGHQK